MSTRVRRISDGGLSFVVLFFSVDMLDIMCGHFYKCERETCEDVLVVRICAKENVKNRRGSTRIYVLSTPALIVQSVKRPFGRV